MALFRIVRESPHSPEETWLRLTTWERHADAVPLTRVTVRTPPPPGTGTGTRKGTVFVARSALGPLGFDDTMEVVGWRPPQWCRLEKRGSFITGWAEIEVHPAGSAGATVVWREELRIRGLPRRCDRPLAAVARTLFGRAVDNLLTSPYEGDSPRM
ncbi:SRPBCC family protein [Actinomycetota bacterium Odt1-20B]